MSSLALVASGLTALQVASVITAPAARAADLSAGSVTSLAGSGANVTVAGTGTGASFAGPFALAATGGFAYVADSDGIAKVATASGITTILTTGVVGADTMATDGTSLYTDTLNHTQVSKTVIATGVTTALAALPTYVQSVTAASGYLYETAGNVVYRQDPSAGTITTIATFPSTEGVYGITTDGSGNLFVLGVDSSSGVKRIAKVVISTGAITTLATDTKLPAGVYSDLYYQASYIYVGAQNLLNLRRYSTSTGASTIIAGSGSLGHADGTGAKAWFNNVNGVTGDGTNLYVADSDNLGNGNYVRKVAPGTALPDAEPASVATATTIDYGAMTTVAGSGGEGTSAGTGTGASFYYPFGITYLNGSLYVGGEDAISKVIPSTGVTTIVAGVPGSAGCPSAGLLGTSVHLNYVDNMTTDGTFVYSAGSACGSVLTRFDPVTTSVSILPGFIDGSTINGGMVVGPDKALYGTVGGNIDRQSLTDGSNTRFVSIPISGVSGTLSGIAADGTYLYVLAGVDVAGTQDQQLYKVNVATAAYTAIGGPTRAFAAGPLTLAGARLYAGGWNHDIVSIVTATGAAQSIVGGTGGYADGAGVNGELNNASEFVSDGISLFVADAAGSRVRRVRSDYNGVQAGEVYGTTLSDLSDSNGDDDAGSLFSSLGGTSPLMAARGDGVNTATQAFTRQETDVTLPGLGSPFDFTRSYSSNDSATGRLGTGWTDPYQSSVTLDGSGNPIVVAEDGETVTYSASAGTFTTPPGIRAGLATVAGGGYTLTSYDKHVNTYNASGQLISEVDRNGKGMTFGYTGALQTSITDSQGRTLTLGYSGAGAGSLLTSVTLADGRYVGYGYTGIILTSVRDLDGYTTTLGYDTTGRLVTETDPMTNILFTNVYDPATHYVTQQTDALGNVTMFSWNATTQTATTTKPDGGVWTDVYNNNVLIQSTDPAGGVTKDSYDANGNLIEVDDPLGRVTTMTYDTNGNMLTKTLNGTLTTKWTYNAANQVLTQQDPLLHTTTWTYDASGNKTSQVDAILPVAAAAKTTWTYNPDGTVATMVDPRGNVSGCGCAASFTTTYGYDANGNLTSVTQPMGEKTGYGYDAYGRRTSVVDPRGYVVPNTPAQYTTTTTYTDSNKPWVVTDPLGHTTTNHYNHLDQLDSVTNDAGKVTGYGYDLAGNRQTVTDPLLHSTTTFYDYGARPIKVQDADGNITTTTYDTRGNKSTVVDPRGNVSGCGCAANYTTTYGYDTDNELTTVSHPLPGSVTATTTTAYDTYGRVVKVTDPNTHFTQTSYDAGGNIATTTDANGFTTTYNLYDNDNRLLKVTDPLSHVTQYTYDLDGHTASRQDPDLRTTSYTYDNDGRQLTKVSPDSPALTTTTGYDAASHVTSLTYSDGLTHGATFVFDQAGRRTLMADGTGTTTTAFDDLNRQTSQTDGAGHVVGYGYDDANRLTTITYPGISHVVTYGYSAGNVTTSVQDWLSHTTTYTPDPAGNYTTIAHPNTATETRTYDIAGRMIGMVDTKTGPSTLATFSYAYDKGVGLITDNSAITGQSADNRIYTYKAGNQINTTPNGSFSVDKADELTAAPASTGTSTNSGYDAAGQLTSTVNAGVSSSYTFNARGDRTAATPTTGTATALVYDQNDMLTSYIKGSVTVGYTYNATRLRMSATAGGTIHAYTWNTENRLPMLLDDGVNTFIYGPTGPIEQIADTGGAISYLLSDQHGSTKLVTDPTGATTGTYKYDAYGNPTHTGTATTQLAYSGQYTDPTTGLQYLRARDYDPTVGQFLTVDSQVDNTRTPYAYAVNNPINEFDPTGQHNGDAPAGSSAPKASSCPCRHVRKITQTLTEWVEKSVALDSEGDLSGGEIPGEIGITIRVTVTCLTFTGCESVDFTDAASGDEVHTLSVSDGQTKRFTETTGLSGDLHFKATTLYLDYEEGVGFYLNQDDAYVSVEEEKLTKYTRVVDQYYYS